MKKSYLFIGIVISIVIAIAIFFACTQANTNNKNGENGNGTTYETENGETLLQIRIHDAPFKNSGKTVEELNITIDRIDIIKSDGGKKVTISEKRQTMDILKIAKSDPVILSTVPVEPGTYEQLRLVLTEDNTIKVDGEVFPIKTPSAQQSGLKLKGPFTIPKGKLFRLDLDFKAEESVIYNKGQGYILKPVIEISNAAADKVEILGYFGGVVVGNDLVFELKSDNTLRLKISEYPDYIVYGDYYYNSLTKILKFKNLAVDIEIKDPFTGKLVKTERKKLSDLNKNAPKEIDIPIKQWSLDTIISIDAGPNNRIVFNRVKDLNFANRYSYTKLVVDVLYPDSSKNGKQVAVELNPLNESGTVLVEYGVIDNGKVQVIFNVDNLNFLYKDSIEYSVTGYLFDKAENMKIDFAYSNGKLVPMVIGSNFSEITDNDWQENYNIVTIKKDVVNKFEISFPRRLNIRMTPSDFSTNNPTIVWDKHPEANNGYFVMVITKDMYEEDDISFDDDGNANWDIVFVKYTKDTEVKIYSSEYVVYNTYMPNDPSGLSIKPGEPIRIEVYVLDSTGKLNTKEKKGAIFMDSLNIIR